MESCFQDRACSVSSFNKRGKSGNSDTFYILGLQNHCRWWLQSWNYKRYLLLERKKLDSVLKSRDITLPAKVCIVKVKVFPVVMYACESWTIKKAERWRIHAFELWCWRRLLRGPWTARRSNQTILKEISPEYSLDVLMLKLQLQYFGHLLRKTDSLEKKTWCWERLKSGDEGDNRGWDGWMASPVQWTWVWASSGSWWWTGSLACCSPWGHEESDTTEQLNWTELMLKLKRQYFGHLMWRADSLEKTLMLGRIEGKRRSGRQKMRWLDGITGSVGMNLKFQEIVEDNGVTKSWTHLSD